MFYEFTSLSIAHQSHLNLLIQQRLNYGAEASSLGLRTLALGQAGDSENKRK
jgi:hypothetical protein